LPAKIFTNKHISRQLSQLIFTGTNRF